MSPEKPRRAGHFLRGIPAANRLVDNLEVGGLRPANFLRSHASAPPCHHRLDGVDHGLIPRASTKVPVQGRADIVPAGQLSARDGFRGGQQHPRRTKAALRSAVLDEGLLQGARAVRSGEPRRGW